MSSAGILHRQIRVVHPSAHALEPPKIIDNILDLATGVKHTPCDPQQAPTVRKAQSQLDVPKQALNLKAIKAIHGVCDRYEEVVGKKTPPVSWRPERNMAETLAQFVDHPEGIPQISIIGQACSALTRRGVFLKHLSYSLLAVAYKLELERTNTALDHVINYLSERGHTAMSKSIRKVKHALSAPLPKKPVSAGYRQPIAGVTTMCTLRRVADWLSQRKQGPTDESNDAMVQLLKECATAAGRIYRLAIEMEVRKFDEDVDFRTKKLKVGEALDLLDKFKPDQTIEVDPRTKLSSQPGRPGYCEPAVLP